MNPTVIMASCADRAALREGTMQNLANLGLPVTALNITLCNPGNFKRHTRQNYELLTQAMQYPGPVLSVEDDIEAKPSLVEWLEVAAREDVITTFSVAHPRFEQHIPDRQTAKPGLYALPREMIFMGAMCLFLPKRVLHGLATACAQSEKGWDTTIDAWARAAGERVYVAFPNPVQHLDPKTTFVRKRDYGPRIRKSPSYDMKPSTPISEATRHE